MYSSCVPALSSFAQLTYSVHVGFGERVEITQLGASLLGGVQLIVGANGRIARGVRCLVEVGHDFYRRHNGGASSRMTAR